MTPVKLKKNKKGIQFSSLLTVVIFKPRIFYIFYSFSLKLKKILKEKVFFLLSVREIAKTVYIKPCDVIGRARTTRNHIVREGLKTSELFAGKPYCNAALGQ